MSERPTGRTRDAGWQIGVSRTLPVDLDTAWGYLVSDAGVRRWLGTGVDTPLTPGVRYRTDEGTTGEVRSRRERNRIRLTWHPPERGDHATVQIALTPSAGGCTVRFHTERLHDADERERMRRHWRDVIAAIELDLGT
jgi:uncharacterized protein YndB with AHSA1/START domain